MTLRPVDTGAPDRLYTVTGGRSRSADSFDLVTLVVSECRPPPECSRSTRRSSTCAATRPPSSRSPPNSLPVTVVRILLDDLRAMGRITARHPRTAASHAALPDSELLKEVLHGLRKL